MLEGMTCSNTYSTKIKRLLCVGYVLDSGDIIMKPQFLGSWHEREIDRQTDRQRYDDTALISPLVAQTFFSEKGVWSFVLQRTDLQYLLLLCPLRGALH